MRLERIVLENFRQYHSKQALTFAKAQDRNVTVIHGINGAGKTSLFLGLNWCLYGRNVEGTKIIDNVGELVSKEAVRRANPGDEVRASVQIAFLHNGDRYIVKRTLIGNKLLTGTLAFNDLDQFTLMRQKPDGKAEPIKNPIGSLNAILHVNAREYFFFDGEKIDNFAKPEAASQVKEAIFQVLRLEMLERSQRHLQKKADEYRRELKNSSGGELSELLGEDEKLRREREKAIKRKEELEQEVKSARAKVRDIDDKLRDSKNAKALQQQRDRLEKDLKQRRTELVNVVEEIREQATSGYFALANDAIQKALVVLNEKRERGEIPSNIRQQFIADLLEQMMCVCGRPFAEHSTEHQHLLDLLQRSVPCPQFIGR